MSNPFFLVILRRLGQVFVAAGVVVLAIGVIGYLIEDEDEAGAAQGTTTSVTTTTTAPTTTAPTTTAPTTTSTATTTTSTTTTTSATTTTAPVTSAPLPGPADVEAFVAEFAAATVGGDVEFLFGRLHPVVISVSDEATCRAYVEREIVAISDYRLTGPVARTSTTVTVGNRQVLVDPLFTAPVAFSFQGQQVETTGQFAPVAGEMRWLTQCR